MLTLLIGFDDRFGPAVLGLALVAVMWVLFLHLNWD